MLALRKRTALCSSHSIYREEGARGEDKAAAEVNVERLSNAYRHMLHELELCKKELEDKREALEEACEV